MTLPVGWPAPTNVETLPTAWLALEGAAWPAAQDGRPAGVVPVGSWSAERELVGSVLPGNVRARSGLSIGEASATIGQVVGEPLAPWAPALDRRVTSGDRADLYVTHNGHADPVRIDLGDWIIGPTTGSLITPQVGVDLIERQYVGRRQANLLPEAYDQCDPIWIVDTLARQVGYCSSPDPVASAVFAAPLAGGYQAAVGTSSAIETAAPRWGRMTGPIGPEGGTTVFCKWADGDPLISATGDVAYLTLNAAGTVRFSLGHVSYECQVEVRPAGVFAIRNGASATWVTGTYTPGQDPVHPNRVQFEMRRTYNTNGDSTAFAVRARSSGTGTWSSTVTHSTAGAPIAPLVLTRAAIATQNTASTFCAIQLTRAADPELWAAPTADLDPLGGRIVGPWLPATTDVWTGIQEICAAHLGAAWVTRDRKLLCRNRDYLAGIGSARKPLDVGSRLADLGWTCDPADTADRLEVTYSLADVVEVNRTVDPWIGVTIWESPDVVELPAGKTVELIVDLEEFANLFTQTTWVPAWTSVEDPSGAAVASVWCAYPNRDGAGAHPADDAVTVTHRRISVGRAVISLRNNTASTLYTVDAAGQPCVIFRASRRVGRGTTSPVERGVSAVEAENPLTIDLGYYVQRTEDAEAIADYIWARVSTPMWRASSVRVKLDWDLDIGDTLQLSHPDSGLSASALVTKVTLDGQPGEVAQTLDLVLLPPTWADFDTAWTGKTWNAFDTVWATKTWNDFDFDPTRSS